MTAAMKHVAIVALPRALGSTITIPLEMLSAANDIARASHQADKLIRIELVSEGSKRVVLSGGLTVQCTSRLDRIRHQRLQRLGHRFYRRPAGGRLREGRLDCLGRGP